ncbi:MAG: hypothetical protein NVS4B10_18610 [Myxococcales bacterium]
MDRIHRYGMPAMIFAVWALCAWTAVIMVHPVMYGPPVSISASAVRRAAPERSQASRTTR